MPKPIDPQLPLIPALPAERPNPQVDPPPIGDPQDQALPGEQHDPLVNAWPEIKEPRAVRKGDRQNTSLSPAESAEQFSSIEPRP